MEKMVEVERATQEELRQDLKSFLSPSVLILALVFLDGQSYYFVSNPATNL